MINLYNDPSSLNPADNLSAHSSGHKSSEQAAPPDNINGDFEDISKKIKIENHDNGSQAIKNPKQFGKKLYKPINLPINAIHLPKGLAKVSQASKEKKLVVKGHCFNIQGFSRKSSNNITVLDEKNSQPHFQIKEEAPKNTSNNGNAPKNGPFNANLYPKSNCLNMPGLDPNYLRVCQSVLNSHNATHDEAVKAIEKQMLNFRQSIQNMPNLDMRFPLGSQFMPGVGAQSTAVCGKIKPPKAGASQGILTKIEQTEQNKTNSASREIRPTNFSKGNVTLDFKSLNLNVRFNDENTKNVKIEASEQQIKDQNSKSEKDLNSLVEASISLFLLNDPLEKQITLLEQKAVRAYMMRYGGL